MKYIMYKISIADYIYIGSTIDYKQRKIQHKSSCNNVNNPKHNYKVYQIIREAGGWDKCEITPIEEFECDGMIPSRIREEYWRREYNANMNSQKAHITPEEEKERRSSHAKEYHQINYKHLNEKHTCSCGGSYSQHSKSLHLRTKKHLNYLEQIKNITI